MPEIAQDQLFDGRGNVLTSTPRTVPNVDIRARNAVGRLVAGRTQLRAIRTQAQAAADASTALTLVQLTTQFRKMAQAVAIETQTLMDIVRIMEWQQDDGQD